TTRSMRESMPVPAVHTRVRAMVFLMAGALALGATLSGCGGGDGGPAGARGVSSSTPPPTPASMDSGHQLEIVNVSTGQTLGVAGESQAAGAAIDTAADDGSSAQRWHAMPMGSGEYSVENMLTHQVIGITNVSTLAGASAVQWADSGTNDHLWSFYGLADGKYVIENINSGLYLQSDAAGVITQETRDSSSKLQEWTIAVTADPAYPEPLAVTGSGIHVHDPDMIQDAAGVFWLYGTHNTLASSPDMATFSAAGAG